MENTAELRNYRLIDLGPYKSLVGQIYNDSADRYDNGTTVRTNQLVELNEEAGYARTKHTKYILTNG